MEKSRIKTRRLTTMAMLVAASFVIMQFEIVLPLLPPFLKLDFSAVPILIGSFALGPMAGIIMALCKAALHCFQTQTACVGELADFIITGSFAAAAGFVYQKNKSRRGALLGILAGLVAIVAAGVAANHFLLLPFYNAAVMPLEAIWQACSAVNSLVVDEGSYLLYGVVPFNLIKGALISIVTFVLYKHISPVIHRFAGDGSADT